MVCTIDDPNGSLKVNFADCDMTDRMGNPVDAYYITEDSILSVAKDIETNKNKDYSKQFECIRCSKEH